VDALVPFFFALGLQPVLRSVQCSCSNMVVCAYIDDVGILGPPKEVTIVINSLLTELPQIGLNPNLAKSYVYCLTEGIDFA